MGAAYWGYSLVDQRPFALTPLVRSARIRCRILAWHLSAKMEVLVCRNRLEAQARSRNARVLYVDGQKEARNDWSRRVQYEQHMPAFRGKYLLECCKLRPVDGSTRIANRIMDNFVGKTMIFDTQDHANQYREMVRGKVGMIYYLSPSIGRIESSGKCTSLHAFASWLLRRKRGQLLLLGVALST